MIYDSLDKFQWTAGSGIALINSDKSTVTLSGTTAVYSDAFSLVTGGTGFTQPMYANIRFDTANVASSTGTATIDVEASDDGGSTWYQLSPGVHYQVALTTTSKNGIFALPVVTQTANRLRLKTTLTGSTPTINVSADLNVAQQ